MEINAGKPFLPCALKEIQTLDNALSDNVRQDQLPTILETFRTLDYLCLDETSVETELQNILGSFGNKTFCEAYKNAGIDMQNLLTDPLYKTYFTRIKNIHTRVLKDSSIQNDDYKSLLYKYFGIPATIFTVPALGLFGENNAIGHRYPFFSPLNLLKSPLFFLASLVLCSAIFSPVLPTNYKLIFANRVYLSPEGAAVRLIINLMINSMIFLNKNIFLGTRIPRNIPLFLAITLLYKSTSYYLHKKYLSEDPALYEEVRVEPAEDNDENNVNIPQRRILHTAQNFISYYSDQQQQHAGQQLRYTARDQQTGKEFELPESTVICAKISDQVYILGELKAPTNKTITTLWLGECIKNKIKKQQYPLWKPLHQNLPDITAPVIGLANNMNPPITSVKIKRHTQTGRLILEAKTEGEYKESFTFRLTPELNKFNPFIEENVELHQNIDTVWRWTSFCAVWLACHCFSKDRAKKLFASLQKRLQTKNTTV
jgi:hypothetical protein